MMSESLTASSMDEATFVLSFPSFSDSCSARVFVRLKMMSGLDKSPFSTRFCEDREYDIEVAVCE